jgi:hypothetical protein
MRCRASLSAFYVVETPGASRDGLMQLADEFRKQDLFEPAVGLQVRLLRQIAGCRLSVIAALLSTAAVSAACEQVRIWAPAIFGLPSGKRPTTKGPASRTTMAW